MIDIENSFEEIVKNLEDLGKDGPLSLTKEQKEYLLKHISNVHKGYCDSMKLILELQELTKGLK